MELKDYKIYKVIQRYREVTHLHIVVAESNEAAWRIVNDYKARQRVSTEAKFTVKEIGRADSMCYFGAGEP